MSVKITGLNLLNSNFYDRILINKKDSNYRIYIQKNKKIKPQDIFRGKGIPTEYKFTDELRDKTDEEKIIMIAKEFLEYANISMISRDYFAYNKIYDVASGTREFRMRLFNPKLQIISQMIINKYLNDRLKCIYENRNINAYTIHLSGRTSYTKDTTGYHIGLELLIQNGKLAHFEKQFLEDLIYTKLNEIGEYADFGPKQIFTSIFLKPEEIMQYRLKCGDLRIVFDNDRYLIKEVEKIVNDYNNLHKQKVMHMNMQMKMEGF